MKIDRAVLVDAIRFWETGRLGYNGALAAILLVLASIGDAWEAIAREFGIVVVLGAIANILYCACYPVDLVMQATPRARAGGNGDGSCGLRERRLQRSSRWR